MVDAIRQPEQRPAPIAPETLPPQRETLPTNTPETPTTEQYEKEHFLEEAPTQATEKEGFIDDAISVLKKTLRKPTKQKPTTIPQVRDEVTLQVEKIMEEGLGDAYIELTPVQKQEFKIKGEQTARQIRELLQASRVKVKKIFVLLVEWMKMLPGVNRFFLEQEAKIKTDRIVAMKDFDPRLR